MPLKMPLLADSLVMSGTPVVSEPEPSPLLGSPSNVKQEYAALGELAVVLDKSGVGDRLARLSCVRRCCGIGLGGDGEDDLINLEPDPACEWLA